MTGLELERIARDVIPPEGATQVVAVVDHQPGARLQNGSPSGLGGRTRFGAAFLMDGLRRSTPIALFDRQADALRLVGILNGRPTSRGGLDTATPVERRAVADPVRPPAPVQDGAGLTAGDTCPGCGGPTPPGRHGQRRATCSAACRQRVSYRRDAEARAAATRTGTPDLTPSRASEPATTDPTHTARIPERGASDEQLPIFGS